jgi:hypothetical protein
MTLRREHMLWLVFAICMAWYGWQTVAIQIPGLADTPSDFRVYYRAAQTAIAGRSPFEVRDYIYPPVLAWTLTPLAALDYVTARRVWFWFSQACLLLAGWLIYRAAGRDALAACAVGLVWALGGAAPESLALGQPGPVLTLLMALAYTQSGWRSGAAAGVGVAIKFIPAVLGIAYALRRERQALSAWAATAALLLLMPWLPVLFLPGPRTPAPGSWTGTPAILSWSLPSIALRLLDPPKEPPKLPDNWERGNDLANLSLPASHRAVSFGVSLATLAAGAAILGIALRWHIGVAPMPWAMAALISLGLAASPVSWTHYQILQYPGLALLLCQAARLRRWTLLSGTLTCGGFLYVVPVAVLRDYYERFGGWTAASVPTLYLWTSVTPLASLALFGLLLREARASSQPGSSSPPSARR